VLRLIRNSCRQTKPIAHLASGRKVDESFACHGCEQTWFEKSLE
jgi:hypothetical protein